MRKEREPSAGENNIRAEDEGRRARAPSPLSSSSSATSSMMVMMIINASMLRSPAIFLFVAVFLPISELNQNNIGYNIPDPECTGVFNLCTDADKERLGRQAIKAIHEQMDDDKDGLIEASEGRDFIKEELESKTDSVRHKRFQKADLQITFDDLWKQWQNNPVYNWTNDDVVHWLINHVHLSIYVDYFRRNQIDGRMIPRLAANQKHYLSSIMQIRDSRHKRRLVIKATDVVLFGPPQRTHSLIKDFVLVSALLVSLAACGYALIRHRKTQESMKTMMKELETLQQAEGSLLAVTGKIKAMENELDDKSKVDRGLLNAWFLEVQKTKEEADKYRRRRDSTIDHDKQLRLALHEIEQLRIALRKAEEHARHQSYEAPAELLDLLKRTYHNEEFAFETKRKLAENAMLSAKEQMNKISKMQKGFFGAVRIAHTGCMDNIGELISAAKERLAEVHEEYEERERRWNRIASLLDRHDLISTSNISTDSPSRSRPNLIESNVSSTSTTNRFDASPQRPLATNAFFAPQTSQHDTISTPETPFDPSSSPSVLLKRRVVNSLGLAMNNDRFSAYPSTNGSIDDRDTPAEVEPTPPVEPPVENPTEDRRSMSSEKVRRQALTSKLFKPFQNLRIRKKSNTS